MVRQTYIDPSAKDKEPHGSPCIFCGCPRLEYSGIMGRVAVLECSECGMFRLLKAENDRVVEE